MDLKGIECDLELLDGKIDGLAREQDGGKIKMKLKEIVLEYKAM